MFPLTTALLKTRVRVVASLAYALNPPPPKLDLTSTQLSPLFNLNDVEDALLWWLILLGDALLWGSQLVQLVVYGPPTT